MKTGERNIRQVKKLEQANVSGKLIRIDMSLREWGKCRTRTECMRKRRQTRFVKIECIDLKHLYGRCVLETKAQSEAKLHLLAAPVGRFMYDFYVACETCDSHWGGFYPLMTAEWCGIRLNVILVHAERYWGRFCTKITEAIGKKNCKICNCDITQHCPTSNEFYKSEKSRQDLEEEIFELCYSIKIWRIPLST